MTSKRYHLNTDISSLAGIGPNIKNILNGIGIHDVFDLVFYFPRYYKDYTNTKKIIDINIDDEITLQGEILLSRLLRTRKKIYEVVLNDGSRNFKIIWFNPIYKYLKENFEKGKWVVLSGRAVKSNSSRYLQIINPPPENYHILDSNPELVDFGGISPIYPLTRGLSQNRIQKIFKELLKNIDLDKLNILSHDIKKKYALEDVSESILNIHLPPKNNGFVDLSSSRSVYSSVWHRSFVFFEFLLLCLGIREKNQNKEDQSGIPHILKKNDSFYEKVKKSFPFELTKAQEKVLGEIVLDMTSTKQMNRLLQGDVSSGKTIIALLSMAISYDNNLQSVMIAPTEILADQHYYFFSRYVKNEELVILKSSLSTKEKDKAYDVIQSGEVKIIIGTHSLFQDKLKYKDLGLVVIDEQHRFGVVQRKLMVGKGNSPDILTMTATPIPRTLSSIFFSDFDVSIIDSLPPRRGEVETQIENLENIEKVFELLENELNKGRQGFIVCPIIDKSENPEFKNLLDVHSVYLELSKNHLKKYNLEMLHGALSSEKKEKIMNNFKDKKIDILISTTVIEVGVDIPNATFMVINNPERFGLSQLHQLRGRIGRGPNDSYCILINNKINDDSNKRLSIFKEISDGFVLSEKDLEIRGPGAFYGAGVEQSGKFWDLYLANLKRDLHILKDAKNCSEIIESFDFYKKNNKVFDNLIFKIWGDKLELTKTI